MLKKTVDTTLAIEKRSLKGPYYTIFKELAKKIPQIIEYTRMLTIYWAGKYDRSLNTEERYFFNDVITKLKIRVFHVF